MRALCLSSCPFAGCGTRTPTDSRSSCARPTTSSRPRSSGCSTHRDPANAVHLELSQAHEDRDERNLEVADVWRRWVAEGVVAQGDRIPLRLQAGFRGGRRPSLPGRWSHWSAEARSLGRGLRGSASRANDARSDRGAPLVDEGAAGQHLSHLLDLPGRGRLTPYLNDLENRPTAARFADEHGTLHRLWVIEPALNVLVFGT